MNKLQVQVSCLCCSVLRGNSTQAAGVKNVRLLRHSRCHSISLEALQPTISRTYEPQRLSFHRRLEVLMISKAVLKASFLYLTWLDMYFWWFLEKVVLMWCYMHSSRCWTFKIWTLQWNKSLAISCMYETKIVVKTWFNNGSKIMYSLF